MMKWTLVIGGAILLGFPLVKFFRSFSVRLRETLQTLRTAAAEDRPKPSNRSEPGRAPGA